ncbi:MAG: hypothetical protein K2L94_00150 [Alphaproteobacteria bacterium]|nr:hypothetical protein [Alphaproteobacteria bacterium]
MTTPKKQKRPVELKCVKTATGKYRLCVRGDDGELTTVAGIGFSAKPFAVMDMSPTSPYLVVRKYGNVQTASRQRARGALFLVHRHSGKVPENMGGYGAARIAFDPLTRYVYFMPLLMGGQTPNFFYCQQPNGKQHQTVSVPTHAQRIVANMVKQDAMTPIDIVNDRYVVTGRRGAVRAGAKQTDISDMALRAAYQYHYKRYGRVPDDLNAALGARFAGYDMGTQTFGHGVRRGRSVKQSDKPSAPRDFTKLTDASLRATYSLHRRKKNNIPDALNAELGRRFAGYDMVSRTFGHKKSGPIAAKSMPKPSAQSTFVTHAAPATGGAADKQPTVAVAAGKKSETPVIAPVRPVVPERVAAKTPVASPRSPKITELSVTLKPVKMTLDSVYNDVYVNGKRILHNHVDTELHTFLGGAILAVRGIVTDNPRLPQRPMWMIYGTDLMPNKWLGTNKFSGYDVYIANVNANASLLTLYASNRMQLLLDYEKYRRLAAGRVFKIKDENTK